MTKIGGGFAAEPKFFGREWRKILAGLMGEIGCRMGIRMHANRTLSQLSYRPMLMSPICELLRGIRVFFYIIIDDCGGGGKRGKKRSKRSR